MLDLYDPFRPACSPKTLIHCCPVWSATVMLMMYRHSQCGTCSPACRSQFHVPIASSYRSASQGHSVAPLAASSHLAALYSRNKDYDEGTRGKAWCLLIH